MQGKAGAADMSAGEPFHRVSSEPAFSQRLVRRESEDAGLGSTSRHSSSASTRSSSPTNGSVISISQLKSLSEKIKASI